MTLRSFTFAAAGALAAAFAAGCATGDTDMDASAEADERLAAFTQTGETRNCLSVRSIDEIEPLDASRWLVTTVGGDQYLNEVSRGCSNAASNFTYLQYSTPTGRLCANEIVRVRDRSTNLIQGSCGLGEYQRLETREDAG